MTGFAAVFMRGEELRDAAGEINPVLLFILARAEEEADDW
jgi:hypothetical protein